MLKTCTKTILSVLLMSTTLQAAEFIRWTGKDDADPNLNHIVDALGKKLGVALDANTFKSAESRDLAFTHFTYFQQTASGIPVENASIRVWTDLATGKLLQMEANIEKPKTISLVNSEAMSQFTNQTGRSFVSSHRDLISDNDLKAIAAKSIAKHEDRTSRLKEAKTIWSDGRLVSVSTFAGKRGLHQVKVDLLTKKIISKTYMLYPQAENISSKELQFDADLYPVYEEFEGTMLPRKRMTLKHILPTVKMSTLDPFAVTRDTRYLDSKMDATQAATPEGRRAGFWSEAQLRQRVSLLASAVPELSNTYADGLALNGRYCSVMLHPEALKKFSGIKFQPKYSSFPFLDYQDIQVNGKPDAEIMVKASFFGKPIESAAEASARPATRHPFHDPVTYINEGFDDLQVYSGVNQFFESLHLRGFTDPELSTRPFTAFLFNPDISMRDNAFYTDDTINFTTYSAKEPNAARDNGTIWHELGHGLMDRLMGNAYGGYLHLADTGGLSEGMADFTADLVLESVVSRDAFPGRDKMRINNHTGFLLTNEVHDDGEAYGGSMHDILMKAVDLWGVEGLHKVTDVTLETMRLTRYHPHLTAADYFEHMLFADEIGRPGVRLPGELASIINESLASRNFVRNGHTAANLSLKYAANEVSPGADGSRGHEVKLELAATETKSLPLTFTLNDGEGFKFHYPVKAKLFKSERGALQGAVHWEDEEKGPVEFTVSQANQTIGTTVTVTGKCDFVNRDDGSCSDYVYLLIFDPAVSNDYPVAKKRFYVRMKPKAAPTVAMSRP